MVTTWDNHWDKLGDNYTYYPTTMFRGKMNESKLLERAKTIFVRRNKETLLFEKAWIGNVFDLQSKKSRDRIYFKVDIDHEIPCPPKYFNYREGWYIDEEEASGEGGYIAEKGAYREEFPFDLKFFPDLKLTNDWFKFEEYTYYLIRCLGLHTTHRFGPQKQKGTADGFFKINNCAVLYECTLEPYFETSKETQIEDYCDQLKKGIIEYNNKKIRIGHCNKSVWIITRDRMPRLIRQIDGINVREVPVEKIIELYRKRIAKNLDETSFERELQAL